MDGFHMDTGAVKSIGNKVDSVATNYDSKVKRIYELVEELNGAWTGADYQAYARKVEEKRASVEELTAVARSYSNFLTSAAAKVDALRSE